MVSVLLHYGLSKSLWQTLLEPGIGFPPLGWKSASPSYSPLFFLLRARIKTTCRMPDLFRGQWDLNSGPHDCTVRSLNL